jgi:thiol-disulfide isomerase/thioredoxin
VTFLTLSMLLQVSVMATDGQNYTDAYKKTAETGQPLVILVGAEWCPGCQTMKDSVIPQLRKKGSLNEVAFAYVNADRQHDLAGKLMKGTSIPQLIVYRKSGDGWKREQLTGAHSVSATESFINPKTEEPTAKLSSR